ncbi:MAG: hypothetical protein D6694_07730, partial [Gammaproteobacteria bacterium]
ANIVKTRSPKNAYPNAISSNRFINTALSGLAVNDSNRYELPGFQIGLADFSSSLYTTYTGDTIPVEYFQDTTGRIPPEFNVIRFRIPPGKKIRLFQQPFEDWKYHHGEFFTVGAWVFSDAENAAQWIYTSNPGGTNRTVGSEFPYISGKWNYVGGVFQNYQDNSVFLVYLTLFNDPALNSDTVDILVAAPVFYWGDQIPFDQAGYVPSTGGLFSGPVSQSVISVDVNAPESVDSTNTTRLYLPVMGNIFKLRSSTPRTIQSINVTAGGSANNDAAELFPGGTVITLLNESPGKIRIQNSPYISLLNGEDWYAVLPGGYLTLVNDPVAVNKWYEIGRGQVQVNYGAMDIDFSDPAFQDQGNQFNLAVPPLVNVVNLVGTRGSGIIRYISQV